MENLIFTSDAASALAGEISRLAPDRVFLLADSNTARYVVPRLDIPESVPVMSIEPGDANKTVGTAEKVWLWLSASKATRHSLLVNVGGGMVTDLGGFVAATFKRGMRFVNVASSLLAMVDASTGGKTAVNLGSLKNEVGVFRQPSAVIVAPPLLSTLPAVELRSGYAEMLKHGVIEGGPVLERLLSFDLTLPSDSPEWLSLIRENVDVKRRVVALDPEERGLRKTLNLGHTVGHAVESLALLKGHPVPHGFAVGWGLLAECVLARLCLGSRSDLIYRLAPVVGRLYGVPPFSCDDYPELLRLMTHDKKNVGDSINFTLPCAPGDIRLDSTADPDDITASLDILRDLLHA